MVLVWPLPEPGLIHTLRSREEIFFALLSAVDIGLFPPYAETLLEGQPLRLLSVNSVDKTPAKTLATKELRPALDVRLALDMSQIERLPMHVTTAMGWQLLPALQDRLGGQFESVILYRQLTYPLTTGRKLSNCLLYKEGALFSAVTWK